MQRKTIKQTSESKEDTSVFDSNHWMAILGAYTTIVLILENVEVLDEFTRKHG